MEHFLRNIKGSLLWKRTLALFMTAIVMAAILPMDVKVAKANEEILSGNSPSAVRLTALNFIAQYTEEGAMVSRDILNQPEDSFYLPSDGRIAVSMTVQVTNPASDITETNYVWHLPHGMLLTGQGSVPVLDSSGMEIGIMNTSDTSVTLRFNDRVLECVDTTANLELYGTIPAIAGGEGGTCTVAFPVLATNGSRGITFMNTLASVAQPEDMEGVLVAEDGVFSMETPGILEGNAPSAQAAGVTDIFDNTTITLPTIELKAVYKNADGTTTVEELTQNGSFKIPYDADISMNLEFVLGDGTAISGDRTYTYQLPDTIRVDVETDLPLKDPDTGNAIGTVHISKDGSLTFQFYPDIIKKNTRIPFYVRFGGGFSKDMQEEGKHADISFPTDSGSFDIHVDTTDSNERKEDKEPGDVIIEKSGARVINKDGRNYIEWTVSLGANGRESLDGVIHDALPEGLTYAAVPGYPTVNQDGGKGTVSATATADGKQVDIIVSDCHPYWRSQVKFCTYYDEAVFGTGQIRENTTGTINNTAAFNPSDGTRGVEATGTVRITPDMVSKTGSSIDANGNITWTVTLNQERLDLMGSKYTDTFGNNLELVGDISVSPAVGTTPAVNADGFTIDFNSSTTVPVTITYTTHVTDLTQSSYTNKATLTGGNYNIQKDASVNGLTLLTKTCSDYNSVTKTFTWQIVVNSAGRTLENVVVTDTFDSRKMNFVSATGAALATGSNKDGGTLIFQFDKLTAPKIITVVTRVNPGYDPEYEWIGFQNHAAMTSKMNEDKPITADAERYVQVQVPELINKSGTIKGDGTIEWTIEVKDPQLTVEGMTVRDVLPEGMVYVPGSFILHDQYWDINPPVSVDPTVETDPDTGKTTLTYNFPSSNTAISRFFKQAFWIKYSTRITDPKAAEESRSYKNDAAFTVTYEGDITVRDDADATVTGAVGGVLDKEYSYQGGRNYVDWTVRVNSVRSDMKDIENPIITDQLADYLDYEYGTLYKVTDSGRVQVPTGDYKVTCVNRRLVVQLPNIGSDCYEFVFRTQFNCIDRELEGKKVTNSVSFAGSGELKGQESVSMENVNFNYAAAGTHIKREIRVVKIDSVTKEPLEGARFELYLGNECIGEAVSNKAGIAVFEGLQPTAGYTFRLKETEAPDGHRIDGTGERNITDYTDANMKTDDTGVRYYEITVPNTPKTSVPETGSIQIKKVNEAGTALSNAQFGVYSNQACTAESQVASGHTVNGIVKFDGLVPGTYYVKEIKSPEGYTVNPAVVTVTITKNGDTIETSYVNISAGTLSVAEGKLIIEDKAAVGQLTIRKVRQGSNPEVLLSGATFGLYTDELCRDRVASETTKANGEAVFDNLELGRTYYYREDKAPAGYVSDYTVHEIRIGTGKETVNQPKEVTVENVPATGNIVVRKVDNSVPAKPLAGIEFQLLRADGNAYTMANGSPYFVMTDSNGMAVFQDIPFGDYQLREANGKVGYVAAGITNVTVNSLGDTNVTVVNEAFKFNIRIVKQGPGPDGTPQNLSGAVFELYTTGNVYVTKGTTNDDGVVEFKDVAYGNYYIKETKAPKGYVQSTERIQINGTYNTTTKMHTITAAYNGSSVSVNSNNEWLSDITFLNDKENGSIRIQKKDGDGNALAGAEFTLYDESGNPIRKMTSLTAAEAAGADAPASGLSEGDVYFGGLAYGTYYVSETKAPDGVPGTGGYVYLRDKGYYKVVVNSDTTVTNYVRNETTGSNTGGPLTIINTKLDILVPIISFKLKKVDSETGQPLAGAVFALYKNGNLTDVTAITDDEGMAYFRRISIAGDDNDTVYTVAELASPSGYVKDALVITLGENKGEMDRYKDDKDTPLSDDVIQWAGLNEQKGTISNDPIKGSIRITKTGTVSTILLPDATFTLYSDADCKKPVSITGVTNPAKTNASGVAVFTNLPLGTYYVKETKAPKGYILSDTVTEVRITGEAAVNITCKDTPINVRISKQAINGTEEVPGAKLTITRKKDNVVIDSWTSTTEVHKVPIAVLEVGTTYVLTEQLAPDGYGYAEAIEFTIQSDGSIVTGGEKNGQTIVMRDQAAALTVSKVDASGAVLPGAILAIYDANNREVDRWTSDTIAHKVPLGTFVAPASASGYNRYTLREISAPHNYEIAKEIEFAVGHDGKLYQPQGGTYTEILDGRLTMTDKEKESNTIYVRKLDGTSQLGLAGAEFQLTCDTPASGYDRTWTSDGSLESIQLVAGFEGTFTLREISAPEGYVLTSDTRFGVKDGKITWVQGASAAVNTAKDTITVTNQRLTIQVRKQNGYGTLLNGARLRVSEYDTLTGQAGRMIAEFTSNGSAAEVIDFTKLNAGRTYILQELEAPEGYQLAEDIVFTLANDGTMTRADGVRVVKNTIIMQDDEAGLGIRKISLEDQSGLAGSTLKLTSRDDPFFTTQTWVSDGSTKTWDFIDFTPGCSYTLTEVNAPDGYAYADPIVFTVGKEDNLIYVKGEVQPNRTVYIADGKIRLTVSKQDLYDKVEIPGAELAIIDEDGNTVVSWISGSAAWEVDTSKLIAGKNDTYKEYILREVKVPNGYYPAADIRFAIDRDGLIYTVVVNADGQKTYELADENLLVMYDEPKFSISKQNIAGKEVPGATLTVTARDDAGFEPLTWISGEEPRYFESDFFTPDVTYVLTETNAPAGYAYTESIEFRIDAEGNVYVNGKPITNKKVIMVDDLIMVYISKQDMTNGKELPGATLVIKNEAGEVIYSFVSGEEPTLIPSEVFTTPKPGSFSYYTLTEITAPEGYEVAETIAFAIDSAGRIYVKNEQGEYVLLTGDAIVMQDKPDPNYSRNTPKTGDRMPFVPIVLLGMFSLFGAYVTLKRNGLYMHWFRQGRK